VVSQRSSRQQIRRLRRHGVQPMTIVSARDALPGVAIVVLAQFVWRYQSELYPAAVAILAEGAAWLHAKNPHAWPVVVGGPRSGSNESLAPGRRQAWRRALAHQDPTGNLPSGRAIADQFGRHERWGRLVKQFGADH
jgi:hypothetical protein